MTRQPTWQEVARALGVRMKSHAFCVDHAESAPDDACPFCRDRAAFRLYESKAGRMPDPLDGATTVTLDELHRRTGKR